MALHVRLQNALAEGAPTSEIVILAEQMERLARDQPESAVHFSRVLNSLFSHHATVVRSYAFNAALAVVASQPRVNLLLCIVDSYRLALLSSDASIAGSALENLPSFVGVARSSGHQLLADALSATRRNPALASAHAVAMAQATQTLYDNATGRMPGSAAAAPNVGAQNAMSEQ